MRLRSSRLASAAISAVLIAGLPACGNSINSAACQIITSSLKSALTSIPSVMTDPAAAKTLATHAASVIRAAANTADGDVQTLGNQAADAMNTLGKAMSGPAAVRARAFKSLTAGLIKIDNELAKTCN